MSKAALRSISTSADTFPLSMAHNKPLAILVVLFHNYVSFCMHSDSLNLIRPYTVVVKLFLNTLLYQFRDKW